MNYYFDRSHQGAQINLELGLQIYFNGFRPWTFGREWATIEARLSFCGRQLFLRFPIGQQARKATPLAYRK